MSADGVDLTDTLNPLPISITIGNDLGQTMVPLAGTLSNF